MRHQRSRDRLKQKPAHARMIKRNLVTSLLLYESVRTTKKHAKVIQPIVDKLIQVAKTRPPHIAIRFINRTVTDKNAGKKIMEVLKDRYADRSSGLTRIVPVGSRKGDGAQLVDLSLVGADGASESRNSEFRIRNSRGEKKPNSMALNAKSRVPDSGFRSRKKRSTKKKT